MIHDEFLAQERHRRRVRVFVPPHLTGLNFRHQGDPIRRQLRHRPRHLCKPFRCLRPRQSIHRRQQPIDNIIEIGQRQRRRVLLDRHDGHLPKAGLESAGSPLEPFERVYEYYRTRQPPKPQNPFTHRHNSENPHQLPATKPRPTSTPPQQRFIHTKAPRCLEEVTDLLKAPRSSRLGSGIPGVCQRCLGGLGL